MQYLIKAVYLFIFTYFIVSCGSVYASENFFLRPVVGLSQLSNTKGDSNSIGQTDGIVDVTVDTGFNAGLGFGYQYGNNIAVEIYWEYRTNDSQALLSDNTFYEEGNYASNIFYLNGFYYFKGSQSWSPYLGAGIGWVQEIDIDFEQNENEESFSGSGDSVFQIFAGVDYRLTKNINANAEIRFSSVTDLTLDGEERAGSIQNIDYQPVTFQVGLKWMF